MRTFKEYTHKIRQKRQLTYLKLSKLLVTVPKKIEEYSFSIYTFRENIHRQIYISVLLYFKEYLPPRHSQMKPFD